MGSSSCASCILTSSFKPSIIIFFISCISVLFPYRVLPGPVLYSVTPNFTASYFQFIDTSGVFLSSPAKSFVAKFTAVKAEAKSFYFVVAHLTGTVIWSANRNNPVSDSSELHLSNDGLTLFDDSKNLIWSTPRNRNLSSISSLQLLESGNLVLLDAANNTVWESFNCPTDLIVAGQKLKVGQSLVSSLSDEDLSESSYSLVIANDDAILRWNGINYWKLSMDLQADRNSYLPVEYMMMNNTGVYLMGKNGAEVVFYVGLHNSNEAENNSSNFRTVQLKPEGVLTVVRRNGVDGSSQTEFQFPVNACELPFICGTLGVCTDGGQCPCAPGFHVDPKVNNHKCVPMDGSLALPGSCNESHPDVTEIHYLSLTSKLDYFSNKILGPVRYPVDQSVCSNLCSSNCSCFGYFFSKYTRSCYMIMDYLGSITTKSTTKLEMDTLGYIKTMVVPSRDHVVTSKKSSFPVLAAVLLPSSGVVAIAFVATLIWLRRKRRRWNRRVNSKLGRGDSLSAEEEIDLVAIPGLPVRFGLEELAAATENFKTQIGSGGFGTVYKGTLQDGSDVAVKKITCMGALEGRREFFTEIAVIGKIHHVNLVRLYGFSAQRGHKFLVYEFMNRGSLDATLFRGEHALEWKERYEIALGTARGLAYLHRECVPKIIHCDIKPENILLHDKSQVKISDFGLAKLLSPEESALFTTLRGTRGYLAPEWLTSSSISEKMDVYSYGMVLLEIVRGKKNSTPQTRSDSTGGTDSNRENNMSSPSSGEAGHRGVYFPLYALDMHEQGRYAELADPRLGGVVENGEVEKLVRVALCCVQEEPQLRPTMWNVVGMLEGVIPLGEPRTESLSFLRFYGQRFAEDSRGEEENEVRLEMRQQRGTNATTSYNSFSYMSSQQVSGPR